MKFLLRLKILRYFVVGGTAAVVDFVIFASLTRLAHVHWFPAGLASFTMATVVNYLLATRFVFQSGTRFEKKHHEILITFLVSLVGLAINQTVLWACIHLRDIDPLIAKVVGTGVVFFWNYGARRYFVFKPRKVLPAIDGTSTKDS